MYVYTMKSTEDDFRHEFSDEHPMLSWFHKYKWQNGLVWIPFPVDCTPKPKVDDEIILVMDEVILGVAYITEAEHISTAMDVPELCVYYDSDSISMPEQITMINEHPEWDRVKFIDASLDTKCTAKGVPEWLSNFLTKKPQ